MLMDARRFEPVTSLETDVCIVGGGVAGITIALSLVKSGLRICLLEGGGERFSSWSQALYDGQAWDGKYSLLGTRTRMLGGSSNCWGGYARPLTSTDFSPRPWLGLLGWPISESDVAPYYAAASEWLQVNPPATDAAIRSSLGPDQVGWTDIGGDRFDTIYFSMSPPTKFGKVYRSELKRAPNVTVMLNATVVELRTDETGERVCGVRVKTEHGEFCVTSKAVVLAAGGVENPRLLLASRARQLNGIGNDKDLVGRHFMDHLRIRLRHIRLNDHEAFSQLYDARHYGGGSIRAKRCPIGAAFSPSIAEQSRARVLQTYTGLVACYFGKSDSTLEDSRQIYKALTGRLHRPIEATTWGRAVAELPDALTYLIGRRLNLRERDRRFELETVVEPWPDRDNRVELLAETDRYGVPKAKVIWRKHEIERRSHLHAIELIETALMRRGLGRLSVDRSIWDSDYWESEVMTTWHHMGTTRMGSEASEGVVDENCRVFGTKNLFVAGSSVFPTGGGSPPTFMIVALALRLAEYVEHTLAQPIRIA